MVKTVGLWSSTGVAQRTFGNVGLFWHCHGWSAYPGAKRKQKNDRFGGNSSQLDQEKWPFFDAVVNAVGPTSAGRDSSSNFCGAQTASRSRFGTAQ